jgi:diguanylate cyclase (GGDEF)-like protein
MSATRPVEKVHSRRGQQKLRFEAAIDNIAEGLSMFDADENLVVCNDRYASMYELPEELTKPGTPHRSIVEYRLEHGMRPAFGAEGFLDRHQVLMDEKKPGVETVTLKNGKIISIRHQPMKDGGWVATHQDITVEIAQAKKLEEQNRRFEAALNNMTQGLCMFDRDKRLVVSNRRYAEMYRIPGQDVKAGMSLEDILRQRLVAGNHPIGGDDAFVATRLAEVAKDEGATTIVEMTDGRTISMVRQPLADGGWVATHEDITEQRRTQARVQHLARHDALTDLPNRILFQEHLEEVATRVRRGEMVGVLCIDLDTFKGVNDTLGHGAGDAVLKIASKRLLDCARDTDLVARLGGDEFAILESRLAQPEDAAALAARIVKAIAEPFDVDGHRVLIGASVGIAVAPIDGEDGEALMRHADLALYRAKGEGRGTYHFYEKSLDAALQERRSIEAGLRAALLNNEFRLVYQPLVNVSENRVSSCEALLRWEHPQRGLLDPRQFISIAEETGLIVPIGEWVLREACATAASWPDHIGVAVNLSPTQFRKNRNLVEHVKSALAAAALRPGRLELEITESVLLADNELALKILVKLKELGVKIAMDDFGTGYSSLSYLRRFPFDKIKIDQSFVQDSSSADSLAIVKAVVGLGQSLGMTTTAEGVETEAQLNMIREQGCTEVQGFLFSVPLSATSISHLLERLNSGKLERHELSGSDTSGIMNLEARASSRNVKIA